TVMIARYLWLTVWPRPLVANYGWPQLLTLPDVWPYALLVVALIALTVVALRYRPTWAFPGIWFFAMLAPTSSILPIATEVGAERRMYLALLALIVVTVLAIWSAAQSARLRFGIVAVLALLLG